MFSRRKLVPACASFCLLATFTCPFSKDTLAPQNRSHHMDAQPAAINAEDSTQASYTDEIRAWHDRRIASLKREYGWLSLVALDWLTEGRNEISSIGTLTLKNGTMSLQTAPCADARIGGKPLSSGVLKTDADQGGPDRVEVGSRAFIVIKRGDRYALRIWDSNAEARKQFTGVDCFAISRAWRIEARWEVYDAPKRIKVASVIPGYVEEYSVPGVAVFSVAGREYRLEPVAEPGARQLFFIFGDKTNGKETYGSGRFLYTDFAKDGNVLLDFNKAINPPCAFTPYATCPLPPRSNRLDLRVEAGEMKFDHQ
jgi:uncharacterized protein (DUF1684 family)